MASRKVPIGSIHIILRNTMNWFSVYAVNNRQTISPTFATTCATFEVAKETQPAHALLVEKN